MYEYYVVAILLFLSLCYIIKNNINNKKVLSVSVNIKKLKLLNENYEFKNYDRRYFRIRHTTRSKATLKKITFEDIILYNIENDFKGLRSSIEIMNYNKDLYKKYIVEFNNLNEDTTISDIENLKLSIVKFNKIEKRLLKKQMFKNKFNINVYIKASYTSPKGQNHYQKTRYIRSDELKKYYDKWTQQKNFRITSKVERSKMSDSIRYDILKRDNYQCKICGTTADDGAKLHIDHIKPVSKGGKTEMSNLQTLCDRCNIGKSNKE